MKTILEFLKDENGQLSAMRATCVLGVALILTVWATFCFRNNTILNIPEGVVYVISILIVGKMGQKFFEHKNSAQSGIIDNLSKIGQDSDLPSEENLESEQIK